MADENKVPGDKPKRTRKSGEYRYQVQVESAGKVGTVGVNAWVDSEKAYKGPTEALEAGVKDMGANTVIRACRIASKEFTVEAVTTTVLKARKASTT